MDDNIYTLAHTQGDDLCVVGLDRHEVVGYDRHVMSVDRYSLCALGSSVYEAETMGFSRLELELRQAGVVCTGSLVARGLRRTVEVHLPINQIVVRISLTSKSGGHNLFDDRKVIFMPPVYFAY